MSVLCLFFVLWTNQSVCCLCAGCERSQSILSHSWVSTKLINKREDCSCWLISLRRSRSCFFFLDGRFSWEDLGFASSRFGRFEGWKDSGFTSFLFGRFHWKGWEDPGRAWSILLRRFESHLFSFASWFRWKDLGSTSSLDGWFC
jgi:hypothetical protein